MLRAKYDEVEYSYDENREVYDIRNDGNVAKPKNIFKYVAFNNYSVDSLTNILFFATHPNLFYYTFENNVATLAKADPLITNADIPAKVKLKGEIFDVTTIGKEAFYNCTALRKVTIPNSVTKIGWSAFAGCSGLKSVTNLALTPQSIDSDVFYDVKTSNCKLYVKRESVDKYKNASVWKDFDIQGID